MRMSDELRAVYAGLSEADGDTPGYDYDLGYLTGWYDVRRSIRRRQPAGRLRDRERVGEFRLGYGHGRVDGQGQDHDWWPTHARGPLSHAHYEPETHRPAPEAAAVALVVQLSAGLA